MNPCPFRSHPNSHRVAHASDDFSATIANQKTLAYQLPRHHFHRTSLPTSARGTKLKVSHLVKLEYKIVPKKCVYVCMCTAIKCTYRHARRRMIKYATHLQFLKLYIPTQSRQCNLQFIRLQISISLIQRSYHELGFLHAVVYCSDCTFNSLQ